MKITPRLLCVVCASSQLKMKFSIPGFPIYMGVTRSSIEDDITADQEWVYCLDCGTIQLGKLLDLELLYGQNHHYEPVGQIWKDHHSAFADFILKNDGKYFVEIGGSHCFLASLIVSHVSNTPFWVIEPEPTNTPLGVGIDKDFAENQGALISMADPLIHSHVVEHLYNPLDFFKFLSECLSSSALMHVSFPNIPRLIEVHGANSLNFEHTYFLDQEIFEYLATSNGFEVVKWEVFREHSFFYTLKKSHMTKNGPDSPLPNKFEWANAFEEMHIQLKSFVSKVISEFHSTKRPIFLFGGHVFSQLLSYYGLSQLDIVGVLDNSVGKIGKRLYGTPFEVMHPSCIENYLEPVVVLVASHYQNEVKDQLKKINPQVRIVEL